MAVLFASIPRCASRTLREKNLIGEVVGKDHARIVDYPNWNQYEWMVVTRPEADWYASWWHEAKSTHDAMEHLVGLRFVSLEDDLKRLKNPPQDIVLPKMGGVHSWIPANFCEEYPKSNLGFMEYCYSIIVGDVPCSLLPLSDLDAWLTDHGYAPIHLNSRSA